MAALNRAIAIEFIKSLDGAIPTKLDEAVYDYVKAAKHSSSFAVTTHLRKVINGREVLAISKRILTPALRKQVKAQKEDETLEAFASKVLAIANRIPCVESLSGAKWSGSVWIRDVWNALPGKMSFSDYTKQLLAARNKGLIALSRADLVEALPAKAVKESEILSGVGNGRLHFIRIDQ
jgi:hypothetical protein